VTFFWRGPPGAQHPSVPSVATAALERLPADIEPDFAKRGLLIRADKQGSRRKLRPQKCPRGRDRSDRTLLQTQSETLPRVERENFQNTVEVTVMLAQTEMGGVPELRGLVVESAGLSGEFAFASSIPSMPRIRTVTAVAERSTTAGPEAGGHCEKQGCGYG